MSEKEFIKDLQLLTDKIRSGVDDQKTSKANKIIGTVEHFIRNFTKFKTAEEKKAFTDFMAVLASNPYCHRVAAKIDLPLFEQFGEKLITAKAQSIIPHWLEIFRSPKFLIRVYGKKQWPDLVLRLLSAGNYTFPKMFFHRVNKYRNKTLFTVLESKKSTDYSWLKVSRYVTSYARGLLALSGGISQCAAPLRQEVLPAHQGGDDSPHAQAGLQNNDDRQDRSRES